MFGLFMYILEVKKELLVGLSLSILYITYYLVEVVKVPELVCGAGEFRGLLERVPLLSEAYWPTPWCVEARLQTVLGSLLRSRWLPPLTFRREILRLSDGGQVALDWRDAEGEGEGEGGAAGTVLVLPGLTGGAHADYVRCVCAAARALRLTAVVFSNRGLGGVPLTTPRLYSAVSHDDLAQVVEAVGRRAPGGGPLLAVGVSLGGLILGNYLAEWGPRARVAAALIVSSPLDVIRGAASIEQPPLNSLLSRHMARALRRTVWSHAALRGARGSAGGVGGPGGAGGGGDSDWGHLADCRSVRQFDAAFTATHFGFKDVDDYYRAATLAGKLHHIKVPTLCLCAADDPFQPSCVLPREEAAATSAVALLVPARGGHIGFLEGWWPARAARSQYIARLAEQYFRALLARPDLLHRPPAARDPDTITAAPAPAPAPTAFH